MALDVTVGALGPLWVGRALWALNKLRRRPSLELHSAMVTAVWDDLPSYTMKDAGHALWGLGCCGRDLPSAFVRDALDTVLQRHIEGVEEKLTRRALLALGELPRWLEGGGEGGGTAVQGGGLEAGAAEVWPVAEGVSQAEQVRLMEVAPSLESLLFLFEHLSGGLGPSGKARALSLVAARLAEQQRVGRRQCFKIFLSVSDHNQSTATPFRRIERSTQHLKDPAPGDLI